MSAKTDRQLFHAYEANADVQVMDRKNRYGYIDSVNRNKKARVYGANDVFAAAEMEREPYQGEFLFDAKVQPRMWEELSDDEREAMSAKLKEWNAWKRETTKVGREGVLKVVAELVESGAMIFEPSKAGEKVKATFSFYAGCSCPCSPGYVLNGKLYQAGSHNPVDLWIEEAKVGEDK